MRVRMSGSYYLHEFEEAIDLVIQTLSVNHIDEVRSITLDFQPYSCCSPVVFQDEECGAPFQILRHEKRTIQKFKVASHRLLPETRSRPVFSGSIIAPAPLKRSATLEAFFGMLRNAKAEEITECALNENSR